MDYRSNDLRFRNLRAISIALLGLGASAGCLTTEPTTGDTGLEARGAGGGGKPDRGGSSSSAVTCTTEPSTPAAKGAIVIDGDPARATSVRVEATNTGDVPRLIGARLRAEVGGERRTVEHAAQYVRPGASSSHDFDLGELRIDTSSGLPTRLSAALIVQQEDGSFLERITLDQVDVGPSIDSAIDGLLSSTRIRSRDLTSTGVKGLTATIVSVDKGDTGLFMSDLDDPDDDGGVPTIPPNYTNAVPDEFGLYHYDFCLRWPVAFDDAGFGEDYGVQPEAAWKARGGKAKIMSHDQTLFDGYLDFNGCTGVIDTEFHTEFWIIGYGFAEVGGNLVVGKRSDGATEGTLRLIDEIGGSGTKYYTFAPGTVTNLVAVASFTLARFGSVSGEQFTIHDACQPDGLQCCNCAVGNDVYIASTQRKFLIGHEMGHAILYANTGGFVNDCSLTRDSVLPCGSDFDHAIDSIETTSCAAMEGWAHFVAVRAFNNPDEGDNPDATLQYWRGSGLTVDVEQGPTGGVSNYYESQCGMGPGNSAGFGVELDWLRTWWDYHTNPSPGYRPAPSVMVDEIAADAGWTASDTYQVISASIAATSGSDQGDRWTQISTANGVDY